MNVEPASQSPGGCLTEGEIRLARPETKPTPHPMAAARDRMRATVQWDKCQFMGRRWPIGCVALEITQRCNLDCTACYLSEHSEAVKDVPLSEILRRVDMIHAHYGPGTGVQITGGDPTLRKRSELIEIVRAVAQKGMQPALFTNGIRAKRGLLADLAEAGLVDVAFHVDMTQKRRGYDSELALNDLRSEYIERARGLRIAVMFNTTVTDENFDAIPDVVAFFVRHSDVVRLCSFQPQADTGRGSLVRRGDSITMKTVQRQIERGTKTPLSFDTAHIGHARCNRYAMAAVTNGRIYDLLDDEPLFQDVLAATRDRVFDRRDKAGAVRSFLAGLGRHPELWPRAAAWLGRKLRLARADLIAARGRVHKLSFFIHSFMDACALEKERIKACSFMVATQDGPISMCLHNAKRDAFILSPVRMRTAAGDGLWHPLTGKMTQAGVVPAQGQDGARSR